MILFNSEQNLDVVHVKIRLSLARGLAQQSILNHELDNAVKDRATPPSKYLAFHATDIILASLRTNHGTSQ